MWKTIFVSSLDKSVYEKFTINDSNHFLNASIEDIFEIYPKFGDIFSENENIKEKIIGKEYTINNWKTNKEDINGNILDIVLHSNDDKLFWEPLVEYLFRQNTFSKPNISNYKFGYIDGRLSHLANIGKPQYIISNKNSGYILWEEITYKNRA